MKAIIRILLIMALCSCICQALFAAQEVPLDNKISRVSGNCSYDDATVTVAGQIYDTYIGLPYGDYVTFDIRGFDKFRARIGFRDECRGTVTVSIEVDGEAVWKQQFKGGEKAVAVDIPLTGKRALTLRSATDDIVFAEPKLIKGQPAPIPASGSVSTMPLAFTSSTPSATGSAPFVVDPNDLEKLALALRKRVDAKPELKSRVDRGNVALMTFTLVDIGSPSVATNVAEDLYTSMINNDFPLVERGQLDKILKELKIQDTALIDPTTAKKIGQMSGCDLIVVGSVSDRGQFVVINARLLETATGKALAAERVEMRKISINHS